MIMCMIVCVYVRVCVCVRPFLTNMCVSVRGDVRVAVRLAVSGLHFLVYVFCACKRIICACACVRILEFLRDPMCTECL
jgi:hypothetical protein